MVSQEELKRLLDYDADSGLFTWKLNRGPIKKGSTAGGKTTGGYIAIRVNMVKYSAHRLVWLYTHGYWPEQSIDHANGNKSDNRLINLRLCTKGENMYNTVHQQNKTGYRGVSVTLSGKFSAKIKIDGKTKYLGSFLTPEEASDMYESKAKEIYGEKYARQQP